MNAPWKGFGAVCLGIHLYPVAAFLTLSVRWKTRNQNIEFWQSGGPTYTCLNLSRLAASALRTVYCFTGNSYSKQVAGLQYQS
eukprot:5066957-Amphidinium_carterae.1